MNRERGQVAGKEQTKGGGKGEQKTEYDKAWVEKEGGDKRKETIQREGGYQTRKKTQKNGRGEKIRKKSQGGEGRVN